eukprot:g4949.t1
MGTNATGATAHDMESGIIPRFLNGLFNGLRRSTSTSRKDSAEFSTRVAFLEIYNEKLIDLLSDSLPSSSPSEAAVVADREKLVIVRERSGVMSVRGLTEIPVEGCSQALELLHMGGSRRQTASTLMNSESSRSHAIFQVIVTRRCLVVSDEEDGENRYVTTTSKVSLVDLAGSERLKRTGAEGLRQREGISINYGLSVLGNVIKALCSANSAAGVGACGETGTSSTHKDRADHIPYRESLLTRLLQDSLGGNSRTLFLACLSPSHKSADETMNTLRYANRAKNIKNNVSVNISATDRKLMVMHRKVIALQNALVWQRFGEVTTTESPTTSTSSTISTVPNEAVIQDLLARSDVKDYLKSITGGSVVSPVTLGGSTSDPAGSEMLRTNGASTQFSRPEHDHDGHDDEEQMEIDQEAALDVMDQILEMERAKRQHLAETSSEKAELQSVEGELTSKMALLSRLREKLEARDAWFQRMESERAKLEFDLEKATEAARAAKQKMAMQKLNRDKRNENSKGRKKGEGPDKRRSAQALEKTRELESHVMKLRRKLVQNQKALRAMRRRQADEGALESQIKTLKQAKARILRSQRKRELCHNKAQKRREQELQALRRKQRSDVQSLTRLKSVNRNQKGILDRRAALLKRNQIALRNTRKQVVALLTQQQQRKVKGVRGCRGKRKNHILAAINGDKKNAEVSRASVGCDSEANGGNSKIVGTKFRLIENHISSMARLQCLGDDLNEELVAKEKCVGELASILSSDTQVDDLQCEDSKDMEKGIDDSLVDSLQLKISMIDERVRAISEEMQALKIRESGYLEGAEKENGNAYIMIDSVLSSMNMAEARAIIRMLVLENIRLQGSMMTEVRKRQREQQEWRQREQRAHARRLTAEQTSRDLRLKIDLWRLNEDSTGSAAVKNEPKTGTAENMIGKEKTAEKNSQDVESAAQIELRILQEECAKLEGEKRLSDLSLEAREVDAKSECAEVLSSCSQLWDKLGVPWKEREEAIMGVENSFRHKSEALLAELQKKESEACAQVLALEKEKIQLCKILGRDYITLRNEEKATLLLQLRNLREVIEPMRIEVDERKFVLAVQQERVAEISRALCTEEENEAAFEEAIGLDDDSAEDSEEMAKAALKSINSVVITKQTSPGCDQLSIRRLEACHEVVSLIHRSVSFAGEKVQNLLKIVKIGIQKKGDVAKLDEYESVVEPSLTHVMDLIAKLESIVKKDLRQMVEENVEHINNLWDELGTKKSLRQLPLCSTDGNKEKVKIQKNEKEIKIKGQGDSEETNAVSLNTSISQLRSSIMDFSLQADWQTGDVHGTELVEKYLTYAEDIASLKEVLQARLVSMEHLRKSVSRIVQMEIEAQSFENEASDKNRLKAGGSRLLEEERFRRHFVKAYPQMLNKLIDDSEVWEQEYKTPLRITMAALAEMKAFDSVVKHNPEKKFPTVRLLVVARKVLKSYQEVLAGSRVHKKQALTLGDLLTRDQSSLAHESLSKDRTVLKSEVDEKTLVEPITSVLAEKERNEENSHHDMAFDRANMPIP